jgi:hypothetical protein
MHSGGSRLAAIALVAGGLLLFAPAASAASTLPSISGGTTGNSTSLPSSSNGGTSLSNDAGGSDNLALTGGAGFNNGRNNYCRNRNDSDCWDYRRDNWDYRDNRNFRNRAPQIASAGNGGVAGSSANGGSVSLGTINSGGNAGNAISAGFPFGAGY